MAYLALEGGDRVSSGAPMESDQIYNGPVENGEQENTTDGELVVVGQRAGDNGVFVQSNGPPQGFVEMTGQYVLSPPPSFDPVFDDLLEGKMVNGPSPVDHGKPSDEMEQVPTENLVRKTTYLKELLRDQTKLFEVPCFAHLQGLLSREIVRVRKQIRRLRQHVPVLEGGQENIGPSRYRSLFNKFDLKTLGEMPVADGPVITITDRVNIPADKYPRYNFVGRLLGPRGVTIREIENESGCRVVIHGRGVDDETSQEEDDDDLYVRIVCSDHKERALFKVRRAKLLIETLMVPVEHDDLKETQLRELASIRHFARNQRFDQPPPLAQGNFVPVLQHPIGPPAPATQQYFPGTAAIVGPCNGVCFVTANSNDEMENNGFIPMLWPHRPV